MIEIKYRLRNLLHKIYSVHFSAHKEILGNETANVLAKETTWNNPLDFSLPVPHSHIKTQPPRLRFEAMAEALGLLRQG